MNLSDVSSGLFKYPFVTPLPPIYNLPGTLIGTIFILLSSTYTFVFEIGFPIVTFFSLVKFLCVEKIVVSVGPYISYISLSFATFCTFSKILEGNCSPLKKISFMFLI